MIIDFSKNNKEELLRVKEMVGKPMSWWGRFKLGGIGSARMELTKYSSVFSAFFAHLSHLVYANVEMRPKGIIIHFKERTSHFGWVIPYYQLSLYKSTYLSFHANGHFMRFKPAYLKVSHIPFFNKVQHARTDFVDQELLFI